MKRVVIFSPGLSEVGGAAKRSRLIARGLVDRGWDVRAITRAGTHRTPRIERSPNLTVVEIPGFKRRTLGMLLYMATAIPLGAMWARRNSTLIAVQLMSTSIAAAICSLIRRRPYLALSTTSGNLSETSYLRSASFARVRRWLLARASSLIAQTPEVASELQSFFPSSLVSVLPNPVERIQEPPAHNGRPLALFAGRLSEEKDLPCLLNAWGCVAREWVDARLLLVGEGGHYRSVESGLRERVARDPLLHATVGFEGWVPDLQPYFRTVDVFVLPSTSEGMSNSLLEACAWHRIVVASDIPSNRAVLGPDYPLLFRPSDPRSLADALSTAFSLGDDSRSAILERVRLSAARFSIDEVIPRLEQMIDAANSTCD